MNILISVNHPAHVHLFKYFIWQMEKRGHHFFIVARDKDKTIDLLTKYGFQFFLIGKAKTNLLGYIDEMIKRTVKFYSIIGHIKPDIIFTQMDPSLAIAAMLQGIPYVCLADTEPAKLILYSTMPFTKAVLTPSCFRMNLGKKHIYYNGYKELAYLHPNIFKPNISGLSDLGLQKNDPFIIIRFVSWTAHHDIGQYGIRDKVGLVKELEKYGRVLITSEGQLPKELEQYRIRISPEKIHDLMYYATLYVGEGATMASETAILGTPAIFISSLANKMGNFIELEQKYGLIFNFNDSELAIQKAIELIQTPDLKQEWQKRRERLLKDKIDVTSFMVWFVENYPESFRMMKERPEIQERFKFSTCNF